MESNKAKARAAINRADSAIASAYRAVLEAEENGANVSNLLKKLNLGAEALTKANMLYRIEDFDEAVVLANSGYDYGVNVTSEAHRLRESAVYERKQRLYLASATSTLGVGFAVFGGLFGWRLFKRRYYKQVLKMTPYLNRKNVLEKDS